MFHIYLDAYVVSMPIVKLHCPLYKFVEQEFKFIKWVTNYRKYSK